MGDALVLVDPPERGPSTGRLEVGDSTGGPTPMRLTPSVIPSVPVVVTPKPGYFFPLTTPGTSLVGVVFPEDDIDVELPRVDPRLTGDSAESRPDAWDESECEENNDDNLLRPLCLSSQYVAVIRSKD